MPLIGLRDQDFLPSIWAEARSVATLHNERTNIPQIITRTEADAIAYNTVGPIRRTTHEVPQAAYKDIERPQETRAGDMAVIARQQYSPVAQNQSNYHPYDYLSYNYNMAGRSTYTPDPNPVILSKIV